MKSLSALALLLGLLLPPAALASTGPAGFAVGINTGMMGIDFSDGTNRFNIGGITQNVEFGVHVQDLAFLLFGRFTDFKGSLTDYLSDAGFRVKWYFTENWSLSYVMTLSRFQITTLSGNVTTYSAYGGGSVGGILGWDIMGEGNNPFRLSVNLGAQRYDFGALNTITGQNSANQDLSPHLNGVGWFGLVGLNWYL